VKKLIIFDLDGTLAESKAAVDAEMAALLEALLDVARVAVISGGDWPQFEQQLLAGLSAGRLAALSLLPTCGTRFYQYAAAAGGSGSWQLRYSEDFTAEERARIFAALGAVLGDCPGHPDGPWGEVVEDRGSQVTVSALGQRAPLEEKKRWDPDFAKRRRMKQLLDAQLPDLSVRLGGTTSIDITRRGIDKAYGIHKLREILGVELDEMLFLGDALFPGGNDHPVREVGVESIQVRDVHETKRLIEAIVACLG
jgi:hypothetical protein